MEEGRRRGRGSEDTSALSSCCEDRTRMVRFFFSWRNNLTAGNLGLTPIRYLMQLKYEDQVFNYNLHNSFLKPDF